MSRYGGYQQEHYQGRRPPPGRKALLVIAVVLAVIVVILAVMLFVLQERMVYGDDGVHFDSPWNETDNSSGAPSSFSSSPILITDDTTDSATQLQDQMPLHAVAVSHTALMAGTAAAQVENTGGNAVVVTMKNDDGTLNYVSAVPLAVSAGVSGSEPEANQVIQTLNEGDLYTIAQVSCFRDHALPGYDEQLAIHTNSGYRWSDFGDLRWISPANETVRTYLTDLCVELAELGFDEILLTNCGYPAAGSGNLTWIKKGNAYPKGQLDTVITPFLEQIRTALEPYEVRLSVQAEVDDLMSDSTATGLTLENALANCDHIWVDGEAAEAYPDFAQADVPSAAGTSGQETADPAQWLVKLYSAPAEAETAWAVLSK